jgi:hypothetical protein
MIGDSHSQLYFHAISPYRPALGFNLNCSGGTARGLRNEKSRSGYGVRVLDWLTKAAPFIESERLPVFFKFGQVDVEFAYIFERVRSGQRAFSFADFEAFADSSVNGYLSFLSQVARHVRPELIRVCSIFPPTLSDACWSDGYVNAHIGFLEGEDDPDALRRRVMNLEIPNLRRRTDMHSFFNGELRKACARAGHLFVDDFSPLLGPNGTVDSSFMRTHDGTDHHLSVNAPDPVLTSLIDRYVSH